MNIAMFSWEALEGVPVGGGAVYASRLAAALARAGHRVRLFTRLGDGQPMDEAVNGVSVRRCPWDRRRGFVDEIEALSASFAHYFADAVRIDGPYDLIHCHEWLTIGAGLRALEANPARLAVSFHSTEWGRTGLWPDAGDSARIAGIERAGIERADAIVTASYWARRKIADQFHPPDWKCEVVYHGADLPDPAAASAEVKAFRERAGIAAGSRSALFAGRFSRQGGGDLAAAACREASARFPDARFVFIGAGALEEDMRREAGANAVFLPARGGVVPSACYQAVDLVLAPFRRDVNGRAVLPAWAAGKPAITLSGTVPSEFVMPGANGWVVEDSPEAVSAAVAAAFENPAEAAWMGRNGRVAVETAFTWDESARRLLSAYGRRGRLTPASR